MTKEQLRLRSLLTTALFAAIIGIMAQLIIPLPLVPITGQTLAIGLAAVILGSKYGTFSVLLYLALGCAGVPVFAEFSAGFSVIVGPTGGYLISYIPVVWIMAKYLEKTKFTFAHALTANIIGMFITLIIGTAWLKWMADLSWTAAFLSGFAPFIIGGFIKALMAAWIGLLVRKRLISARLLFTNQLSTKAVDKSAS
ncbi:MULTISPECIES: biotin transporter BioY [Cytobacillus]|uniref:biotin transporter BioY n=1 Tax=Cytobacillus TaxID=2675230 RepID=UPI001CD1E659|nr:biotin transporter BioY [Cytobacillus kochii]MCA1026190.1 biotin transporter BioY [Cytobacillus kochii]MCM3321210.1 biotin transporter BioY [Cytobacillus kochii]MCM3343956.1 biotin transporter BioY [Cytobacillus kochii]